MAAYYVLKTTLDSDWKMAFKETQTTQHNRENNAHPVGEQSAGGRVMGNIKADGSIVWSHAALLAQKGAVTTFSLSEVFCSSEHGRFLNHIFFCFL